MPGSLALDLRGDGRRRGDARVDRMAPLVPPPRGRGHERQGGVGRVLETRADLIPTGRVADLDGATDLRAGPRLGARPLCAPARDFGVLVHLKVRNPAAGAHPGIGCQVRAVSCSADEGTF
jgi:hypothetical protein